MRIPSPNAPANQFAEKPVSWLIDVLRRSCPACVFAMALAAIVALAGESSAGQLDQILAKENASKDVTEKPVDLVDDMGFARRVCLDLAGRIPTGKEIATFLKWPEDQRRQKLIALYMQDDGFANRWSAFYADMLRIRSNEEGGTQLLAYVHNAITTDMPYDEMCRKLISANGKAGRNPEIGFVLGDDADPWHWPARPPKSSWESASAALSVTITRSTNGRAKISILWPPTLAKPFAAKTT